MRLHVSCRMRERGQTVPSSRAPVHAPFHIPPCPIGAPPPAPSFAPPPSCVPFWPRAESTGCKGCLHAAPHVAAPCRLVRAPPVWVPPPPSPPCPLLLPLS